jgi:sec-independent protein translocase protein TatB
MLDIGWSELLVIAVVAIVVVGPKDLPPMMRALGRTVTKMRKMAGEFQGQFNEALKEAELDDVKKSFDELRGLNPINDIKNSLNPLSGPVAKPAPAPVPPAIDQPAQPLTAADVEPAPSPEAPAAKPAPKPRAPRKSATTGDSAAAKPRKPRAKAAVNGDGAAGAAAAPRKPRKPKSADAAAPSPAASEPAAATATEEPKT